jgi:hypothetical protein
MTMLRIWIGCLVHVSALAACGSPPAPAEPSESSSGGLTAEQCEASGGSVVGDIGDGATQRPDYKCANGAAPSGKIVAPAGGPVAVEGAVCCPK